MPTKGLSEAMLYGEKEVKVRMGVTPKQIPDFKALAGDSSDNYPGVEGVGPKTAVSLIEQTDDVRELYRRLENGKKIEASESLIEKLRAGKESAILSHDLATIRTDVPIDIQLEPFQTFDTPDARRFFETIGFKTLLKRLTGEGKVEKKDKKKTKDDNQRGKQESLF